jgi:Rab-GTPase-TBC domain
VSLLWLLLLLSLLCSLCAAAFSYRQGMNTICAPLLLTMPEVDAYCCFRKMIVEQFPLYWAMDHSGIEAACVLVDELLKITDKELYEHLSKTIKQSPAAQVYAFFCTWLICCTCSVLLYLLCLLVCSWFVNQLMRPASSLLSLSCPCRPFKSFRKYPST